MITYNQLKDITELFEETRISIVAKINQLTLNDLADDAFETTYSNIKNRYCIGTAEITGLEITSDENNTYTISLSVSGNNDLFQFRPHELTGFNINDVYYTHYDTLKITADTEEAARKEADNRFVRTCALIFANNQLVMNWNDEQLGEPLKTFMENRRNELLQN